MSVTINIDSQVFTFANLAAFPATGAVKTIYIAEDVDLPYYWTGFSYQALGAAPSSTAFVDITGQPTDNTALASDLAAKASVTSLNTEITNRTNADSALQTNINTEATARSSADSVLQANITQEIADRTTADAAGLAAAQAYADGVATGVFKDQGNYDASVNTFPVAANTMPVVATIKKGFAWEISVAGTLGGQDVQVGDIVRALINSPGQTAGNWNISERNLTYVPENVSNKTDVIVGNETSSSLYASIKGIIDYFTGARIRSILGISVLSGSNTGDQDLSGLATTSALTAGLATKQNTFTDIDEYPTPTTTATLSHSPTFVYGYYLNGQKAFVGVGGRIASVVGTTVTFTDDETGSIFNAVYKY